jgi:hypothetical protein
MAAKYVPARGDLVWLQFTAQAGHEQAGGFVLPSFSRRAVTSRKLRYASVGIEKDQRYFDTAHRAIRCSASRITSV